MRLSELDARFVRWLPPGEPYPSGGWAFVDTWAEAQGLWFQCPKCALDKPRAGSGFEGVHYILCWFRNPRQLSPVADDVEPTPGRWWAEGEGIADLTFGHGEPKKPKSVRLLGGCNAHFHITAGEIR